MARAPLPPDEGLLSQGWTWTARGGMHQPKGAGGWDGPVEILLPGDARRDHPENDLWTLLALMRDSLPANWHELRLALTPHSRNAPTLQRIPGGWLIIVHNVYALAQDLGAQIPERWPTGSGHSRGPVSTVDEVLRRGSPAMDVTHVLHFLDKGGNDVFTGHAKGFELHGIHYIQTGFDRWLADRGHGNELAIWAGAGGVGGQQQWLQQYNGRAA